MNTVPLTAADEAARAVLPLREPADTVLSRFFKAHPRLGARDREFVAETVYTMLRRLRTLEGIAGERSPRRMLLACLTRFRGLSIRDLERELRPGEAEWLAGLKGGAPAADVPLPVRAELPDWIVDRLRETMDEAAVLALGQGMQGAAALDLRVNPLRAKRDAVLAQLVAEGLEARATPWSPLGIRVTGRPPINRHPLFLDGSVEVQDEGSQLLGFLLAPRRRELVVDFCAGAGGKTLLLGALMHSHGRLYALDTSSARLARLRPRLARSGLSNVHPEQIEHERDARLKRLAGKCDRVLVDAPCSGLGTLRRNPDLKWRQSAAAIPELAAKQTAILAAASRLVRPGGRLVYATCSLLVDENDAIADAFLAAHPEFRELSCTDALAASHIVLDTGMRLRIAPHTHGTDGFFAATFERAAAPAAPKDERHGPAVPPEDAA